MTKQVINVGTTANDKKGDSLRAAFQKVNANFTELYEAVGLADTGQDTTLTFLGSTISTDDSSSIVIDRATTVTSNLNVGGDLLPQSAYGGDLGSSSLPWRSLYVSNNTIYIGGVAVSLDSQNNLTVAGTPVNAAGSAAWASITGKPTFATVATSGSYADLSNKPTIPADIADLTDTGNLLSGSTSSLVNGANTVSLGSDGTLTLPGTGTIRTAFGAMSINAPTGSSNLSIKSSDATTYMIVGNGSAGVTVGAHNWQFSNTGNLTFPDATVQTTAYTGPQTTLDGDVTGSVFADDSTMIIDGTDGSVYANKLRTAETKIAIGSQAGTTSQGSLTVAVGSQAGENNQGIQATAVGSGAGNTDQGAGTVAIGTNAGAFNQGLRATAIGSMAGGVNQGEYALALGNFAGGTDQPAYSIMINASGSALNGTEAGLYINPVRNATGTGNILQYNTSTKEITYSSNLELAGDIRSEGNINIDINLADSTLRRWQFGEDGVFNVPGDVVRNGSPGLTLGASHNVYIVGDRGDNNRTWTFDGTSGDTELPNGTVIADDGNDGIEIVMPTTTGQANKFEWRFTDLAFGISTLSLQAGTLDTNLDDWYFGFNSTKYLGMHGATQSISWFNGADLGGKVIFGAPAGNNAGDANAIELKAADGDVYLTSTESVKITVDANDSSARIWTFDPSGNLNVPGGIVAEYEEDFTISTSYLALGSPPGPATKTFTFAANGTLTVPRIINATEDLVISSGDYYGTRIQAGVDGIIYIGYGGNGPHDIFIGTNTGGKRIVLSNDRLQIMATAPGSSKGSSGDYAGMVAFNGDYIFYCVNAYDGTTDIWKRVALTGGTW